MKLAVKISALGIALMGLVACQPGKTNSRLQEEPQAEQQAEPKAEEQERAANPFPVRDMSEDDSKTAAARIGYLEGDGNPANGKCIGCHQNFHDIDELEGIYNRTQEAYSCFDQGVTTADKAKRSLNCLARLSEGNDLKSLTPHELGFMAAGVDHKVFKDTFEKAGRSAEYEDFKANVGMPMGGTPWQDKDFEKVLSWVLNYYPGIEGFLTHDGPDVCRSTADTHVGSKVKEYVQRMSEGGQGWEYVNLSRGVSMFACTDGNKHNCFTQQNDGKDIFTLSDNWKAAGLQGHVRILHKYDQYTDYWIRASADGRYVGNGGTPSAIIDLQDKLKGEKARKIKVEAMYDPGFLSDNSGFIFQGQAHGSRICEQSILDNRDLVTIDFLQIGCSKGDLEIGLYQGLGNNLDSGDIRTLSGYFSSDDGYYTNRDISPLFGKSAGINIDTIRRVDGNSFEKVDTLNISTPYHGSWMMSPANQLAVAIVSAATDGKAHHGGYRLFVLDDKFAANGNLPDWSDESTALLCTGGGEKPNVSFNERMLTFYRYAKQDHRIDSVNSSSDIYIYDLLKGKEPVALTAMPLGFYAQFPHFRSDGWLYFTVYNAHTDERFIVATDVGLYVEEAAH